MQEESEEESDSQKWNCESGRCEPINRVWKPNTSCLDCIHQEQERRKRKESENEDQTRVREESNKERNKKAHIDNGNTIEKDRTKAVLWLVKEWVHDAWYTGYQNRKLLKNEYKEAWGKWEHGKASTISKRLAENKWDTYKQVKTRRAVELTTKLPKGTPFPYTARAPNWWVAAHRPRRYVKDATPKPLSGQLLKSSQAADKRAEEQLRKLRYHEKVRWYYNDMEQEKQPQKGKKQGQDAKGIGNKAMHIKNGNGTRTEPLQLIRFRATFPWTIINPQQYQEYLNNGIP